jgi:3-hydroxyacyl-CoA dehydrogenase
VNGLGLSTRTAVVDGIRKALADDAVKAIVITGAGKAFSGGADIREFNSPKALAEPSLHTLIDVVESAAKPVIAAIHSVCMGGGLELALGCHYRVAVPGAQVALPEVKLGLLPGAGGTQRLTRICGDAVARQLILGAEVVDGSRAAALGIVHQCVPAQALEAAARAQAERIAAVPGAALAACKRCITAAVDRQEDGGFAVEIEGTTMLYGLPETQALVRRFLAG